jgi:predicted small secreted protein
MTLRTKLLLLLVGWSSLLFASCNTISGLGQDMQRAGQGMENKSQGRNW